MQIRLWWPYIFVCMQTCVSTCGCVYVCVCVCILKKERKLGKLFLLVIVGLYIIGSESASAGESKGDLNNPLFLFYISSYFAHCVLHNIVSFDFSPLHFSIGHYV